VPSSRRLVQMSRMLKFNVTALMSATGVANADARLKVSAVLLMLPSPARLVSDGPEWANHQTARTGARCLGAPPWS
jgi:hypothetical protein